MANVYIFFRQVDNNPEVVYAVYTSKERAQEGVKKYIAALRNDRNVLSVDVLELVKLRTGGLCKDVEVVFRDGTVQQIQTRIDAHQLNLDFL